MLWHKRVSVRDNESLFYSQNLKQTLDQTLVSFIAFLTGGWANTRSAIRLQQGSPNQAQIDNDPLDCDEFRPFWASWESGVIRMGTGLTVGVDEFISYTDATPTQVNQVAVATNNIVGDWIINGSKYITHRLSRDNQRDREQQTLLEMTFI